jgi:hypothetical protein
MKKKNWCRCKKYLWQNVLSFGGNGGENVNKASNVK